MAGRLERLVDAQDAGRTRINRRITRLVAQRLEGFDGWYTSALVEEISQDVAALVGSGQRGVAGITDAYLAQSTSIVFDRAVSPAGVSAAIGGVLRSDAGSLPLVYQRLAEEYRYRRSLGLTDPDARNLTLVRSNEMVGTDLGLAHQRQVADFTAKRNVTRYRRVIRSEKTCGLCVAASDRIYRRSDLLPIHSRCRCAVIAVTANTDPGSQLNNDTLTELYAAGGGTDRASLKKVRVEVVQHGELGPQLRVQGQQFRGPDQVAAA